MRTIRHMKSLCWLICGLAITGSVLGGKVSEAATFYVATTGTNSNSCAAAQNPSTPKRTINVGIACLSAAGDVLSIANGTYNEMINLSGASTIPNGTSYTNATTIRGSGATVIQPLNAPYGNGLVIYSNSRVFSYIVFDRLTFDMSKAPPGAHGVQAGGGAGIDHIRITNCVFAHAQYNGVLMDADYAWIDRNEIYDSGRGGKGHGIYWTGRNSLIERNYIHDNLRLGAANYTGNGDASGNVWRYNLFKNNDKAHTSTAAANLVLESGSNMVAYNNIFIGTPYGIITSSSSSVKIYNNTIYNTSVAGIAINKTATNVDVKNNLVSTQFGKINNAGPSSTFAGNLCLASGSNCAVVGNPLFVNAANGDFTLQSGSPAINSGVTIGTVKDDYTGTLRPIGAAYDIGAYEYGGGQLSAPGGQLSAPSDLTLNQ